ncbi:unnamed protein product [Meloidogyne enterolobii]|uniref:Uncharacterized protein n=1 Tax=Meloidogyne enterolobii TaxID=390850 RepID=A0ACB1A805_MELEN
MSKMIRRYLISKKVLIRMASFFLQICRPIKLKTRREDQADFWGQKFECGSTSSFERAHLIFHS